MTTITVVATGVESRHGRYDLPSETWIFHKVSPIHFLRLRTNFRALIDKGHIIYVRMDECASSKLLSMYLCVCVCVTNNENGFMKQRILKMCLILYCIILYCIIQYYRHTVYKDKIKIFQSLHFFLHLAFAHL